MLFEIICFLSIFPHLMNFYFLIILLPGGAIIDPVRGTIVDPVRGVRVFNPNDRKERRDPQHLQDPRAMLGYPNLPPRGEHDREVDLSRRGEPIDKGPLGYKGDPTKDIEFLRNRPDTYQRSTAEPTRHMGAPPPAHQNHPQDLQKHRPDSRNKSPSIYQVDNVYYVINIL